MLILKFREFLLREGGQGLMVSHWNGFGPAHQCHWVHKGWESWSFLAPLIQWATTSLLYQPLLPTPSGKEIPPSGTVHPACCCPLGQRAGLSTSSGGKSPRLPSRPTWDVWLLVQANLKVKISYLLVIFPFCGVHSVVFILFMPTEGYSSSNTS